jgi:hypothetical protein
VEGNTMSGCYQVQDYTFPFILTRTGAADIAPLPRAHVSATAVQAHRSRSRVKVLAGNP